MTRRALVVALACALAPPATAAAARTSQTTRSIWSGVYTGAQAKLLGRMEEMPPDDSAPRPQPGEYIDILAFLLDANHVPAGSVALLRAYDKATGADLGAVEMPDKQTGSPMTFMINGKQYIVVAVSGNDGAQLIAYELP